MSKSLFASKTFWIQVLTVAAELSSVLPLPPGIATAVGGIATVLVRSLSEQKPLHVFGKQLTIRG